MPARYFFVILAILVLNILIERPVLGDVLSLNGTVSINESLPLHIIHDSVEQAMLKLKIGHTSSHTCGIRDPDTNELRKYVIIISISTKYFGILLNWLALFHQLCPDRSHIYFICLDKETETKMYNHGLSCSYNFAFTGSFNKLWLTRVAIANRFLHRGIDVLLSDVDAFWLKNPFIDFEKYPKADIIATRASFPVEVSRYYGASFCFGFMYIKASFVSTMLLGSLHEYMNNQNAPDDQRSFNVLLLRLGFRFPRRISYVGSLETDVGTFHRQNKLFTLALLPHESYRRHCTDVSREKFLESTVVHCLAEKAGNSKEKVFKAFGIWLLKPKYDLYPYSSNDTFDSYLKSILARRLEESWDESEGEKAVVAHV